MAEARRAVEDDPRSSIVTALASQIVGMSGDLDLAQTLARLALEIDDRSVLTNASATLVFGRGDEAMRSRP